MVVWKTVSDFTNRRPELIFAYDCSLQNAVRFAEDGLIVFWNPNRLLGTICHVALWY